MLIFKHTYVCEPRLNVENWPYELNLQLTKAKTKKNINLIKISKLNIIRSIKVLF